MDKNGEQRVFSWRIALCAVAFVACMALASPGYAVENGGYPRADFLVSTQWLEDHLNDPNVRIIDRQDVAPEDDFYAQGHIPNAIRMPTSAVKGLKLGVPEMLIIRDLITFLESHGVSADHHVVVVSSSEKLPPSTRVFWALEVLGHKKVSVLDGGLDKWRAEKRPWTTEVKTYPKTTYRVDLQRSRLVTGEELVGYLGIFDRLNMVVVDARRPEEYAGQKMSRASEKLGRIPGAVNLGFPALLTGETYKEFKPAAELKKILESHGVTPDKTAFFSCVSGCFGSAVYFAARLLDYPKAAVYDGSWMEWSRRGYPVEGGAQPSAAPEKESQAPPKAKTPAKRPALPSSGC
ncbi:MAG: sulfurtransferase [Desulfomonilaceae bacterium]